MKREVIKACDIVNGDECSVTISGQAQRAMGGVSFVRQDGGETWLSGKSLDAAAITRHEREPQVGDVGTVINWLDIIWEIVATRDGRLVLWNPVHRSHSCRPSDFTVTKRAG